MTDQANNSHAVKPGFERASTNYDHYAVLQRQVAEEMLDRLDLVTLAPEVVVDVGCGTGFCTRRLGKRYGAALTIGIDLAAGMVQQAKSKNGWFRKQVFLQADAISLPLRESSVDLVFSNLMLQWCDPAATFAEFRRVLKDEGLLSFSSFGTDTLKELKVAWAAIDDRPHVIDFADMHDLGDELVRTGFREPVMDADRYILTYGDVLALLRDLHGIGSRNIMNDRRSGLMGKGALARLEQAYRSFADNEQRLPASYEVVYGHAWSGGRISARPGEASAEAIEVPVNVLERNR